LVFGGEKKRRSKKWREKINEMVVFFLFFSWKTGEVGFEIQGHFFFPSLASRIS